MSICNDPRCPICYPKRQEDELAAKQRAKEERDDCVECWRFFQKKAECRRRRTRCLAGNVASSRNVAVR